MAKKSRRARRGAPPVRHIPRASTAPVVEELEEEAAVEEVMPVVRPTPTSLRSASGRTSPAVRRANAQMDAPIDYSYVIKDLKRVGILALTFIGALVALSFVLQ